MNHGEPRRDAKLPKNYEVLRGVVEAKPATHQTAYDVFAEARRRLPTIGFATVHRGLARLCELGVILKVDVPGGDAAWYEPASKPHAHLLCDGCHRVVDVDYHVTPRQRAGIATREGLQIDSETVLFHGRCHECASRGPTAS